MAQEPLYYFPFGGFPPRPLPDLRPVVEGQPAPCGSIGGCPWCFDISITSFMWLK